MRTKTLHQMKLIFYFYYAWVNFKFFYLHLTSVCGEERYLVGVKYLSLIQILIHFFTSCVLPDTTFSFSINIILSSFNVLGTALLFSRIADCLLQV